MAVCITKKAFKVLVEKEGDRFYVLVNNGFVCKLSREFKHVGGILQELHGRDATEWIETSHRCDAKVQSILEHAKVGRLVDENGSLDPDALLPLVDRNMRSLRQALVKQGYFQLTDKTAILTLLEPLVIVAIALGGLFLAIGNANDELSTSRNVAAVFFAVLACIGYLRLGWWNHDTGHHSIHPDAASGWHLAEMVALLVNGFPADTDFIFRPHAIHHAFPNILAYDWTEDFLWKFQVAPQHLQRSGETFTKWQFVLWFGLALPMFGVKSLVQNCVISVTKGEAWKLAFAAVRATLVLTMCQKPLALTIMLGPLASLSFLAYVSQLEHLHMPKVDTFEEWAQAQRGTDVEKTAGSFVFAQVAPTNNIVCGALLSYLIGGLDCHIEHHIFPTLPSRDLRSVRGPVRKLCMDHGIPFHTTSLWEIMRENFKQVCMPERDIPPPMVVASQQ